MFKDSNRKTLRSQAAGIILYAGILMMVYALFHLDTEIEGARRAGSALRYLGAARWQDNAPFVFWAFSFPAAGALVLMAAGLRNTGAPSKLTIGIPVGFMAFCAFAGFMLTFPTVVPGFFGVGGAINAICILFTTYLCGTKIRRDDPWPGFLRNMGYLGFAFAAWITCGVFSTPGAILLPDVARDQATITDLAHKVQIFWVFGWVSTMFGFVLERRRSANPQR